ncbi:GAF and ANTAR domain-containing protein [Isoptericola sp. NEAU-Y5]|uniref:GAF and ANTAR domain-containing protein n=1 Tax=Isoptericola luteus TaxID=2879484 RepID=A0ABS7ZGF2_9MICO|nr:GAF and ANTAR domain-containing protein [Isoptericola sp. NEAU-Y5]MCA5893998.1 GAF and ANTAR domain-containing protein [Isoptericola sp. NEAU-Y5]
MEPTQLLSLLARSLAKVDTDRPLAMRLCEACVDILRAQGGALTVSAVPGERLAVSTPGAFEQLEPLQEVLGEGPVHQAMSEDRLVVMHVDGVTDDYPVFSQLAGTVGGQVMLYAVPMRAGGRVVGVFSLYVTADPQDRSSEDLQFLADAVGASLLGDADSLDWSERAQIHQATGMVTAQLRVPPEDALAVLRAHAFARSTSLLSVALDVLERRLTFSLDESQDDTIDRTEDP